MMCVSWPWNPYPNNLLASTYSSYLKLILRIFWHFLGFFSISFLFFLISLFFLFFFLLLLPPSLARTTSAAMTDPTNHCRCLRPPSPPPSTTVRLLPLSIGCSTPPCMMLLAAQPQWLPATAMAAHPCSLVAVFDQRRHRFRPPPTVFLSYDLSLHYSRPDPLSLSLCYHSLIEFQRKCSTEGLASKYAGTLIYITFTSHLTHYSFLTKKGWSEAGSRR